MNRILFVCILILMSALTATAQTMGSELDLLREQLGVSADVPIALADSSDLPAGDSLKVFIAVGLDMDVRKRTVERIAEWNKKDAKKYGALEIVTDLAEANVILAHYSERDRPINKITGNSKTVTTTTYIPGNSYIIIPQAQGFAVVWRYQGKWRETGLARGVAGQTMRDHFFDMLKKRKM